MSHPYDPRDRWRWREDQRQREERDRVEGEAFARDAGDPRWGTGGMRAEDRPYHPIREYHEYHLTPREESTRGPYVGVGPRGYRRSDERIREDVCERFAEHGHLDPSDVEVDVREGEVLLNGTVATRAQKRLAEDIADDVFGVAEVHNHLRVARAGGGETRSSRGAPASSIANGRLNDGSPSPDRQ
jgi:hypothetical protein